MKHKRVIHTYTEHKVELFWWIVYLLTMLVGFLTGLALIVTPIALFLELQLAWLLILFIFIPIGGLDGLQSVPLHEKTLLAKSTFVILYSVRRQN